MIKIQEHLNRVDAEEHLENLAERLWNELNKKLADGTDYKKSSLIKRLDSLILKTNEQQYLLDIANNDNALLTRQKSFLNYLHANSYKKLKDLIISRPEDLLVLKGEILNIIDSEDFYNSNGRIKQTAFGKLLIEELFKYKNFRQSQLCPDLVAQLELQNAYCPYCNYVRIQVVDVSMEEDEDVLNRAYLDIDHFFPKSQNPYFALSFFNLIPSCHSCNSAEKGDKEFCITSHTNPFHKSYNLNHVFEIDNDSVIKGNTTSLNLRKITPPDDFMDRDLHLNQRYEHTYIDGVNELIANYINYQHYRDSVDFNHDYQDVMLQRVPGSSTDILKLEAGKMFRDVLSEIDVFDLLDP